MLALIQRVREAAVTVASGRIAAIGPGLLVFLGVQRDDTTADADRLLKKVLGCRVFADADGRMNLDVQAVGGGLLVVSQFTLAASTDQGLRPGFSGAKPPAEAEVLYRYFVAECCKIHAPVETGRFGADMQVALVNDGPVTFLLRS